MDLYSLRLILYDTYQMDIYMPPPYWKYKKDFAKQSYKYWAIDELCDYIESKFPEGDTSVIPIEDLIHYAAEFQGLMNWFDYFQKDRETQYDMFSIAQDVTTDVLDLLRALK